MLEYLTVFLPIESDEKMTDALNIIAADGWSMSRFEAEMGVVQDDVDATTNVVRHYSGRRGYRCVWVKDHGPMEGSHAHGQAHMVPFNSLPPHVQQIIQAMGGPGGPPSGYQPKPHKSPEKGREPA